MTSVSFSVSEVQASEVATAAMPYVVAAYGRAVTMNRGDGQTLYASYRTLDAAENAARRARRFVPAAVVFDGTA